MTTRTTKRPVSTHYYRHDPDTGHCREPGLHGGVCGLPSNNQHHTVRIDPAITNLEARRIGERGDP